MRRSPSAERGSGTGRPVSGGERLAFDDGAIAEAGHLAWGDWRLFEADTLAQHAAQPQNEEKRDARENNQGDRKTP